MLLRNMKEYTRATKNTSHNTKKKRASDYKSVTTNRTSGQENMTKLISTKRFSDECPQRGVKSSLVPNIVTQSLHLSKNPIILLDPNMKYPRKL